MPDNLSYWVLRLKLSREKLIDKGFRMFQVAEKLRTNISNGYVIFSDDNSEELIVRIRQNISTLTEKEENEFRAMKKLEVKILKEINIRGLINIKGVAIDNYKEYKINENGGIESQEKFQLITTGSNLKDILGFEGINSNKTYSNDVRENLNIFGIEAARATLLHEFNDVIEGAGASVNYHHLSILIDNICSRGYLISIDRFGVNKSDIGPLAKCSFEESTEQLISASVTGERDPITGVSSNIMMGQIPISGTGIFNLLYDENSSGVKTEDIENIFD